MQVPHSAVLIILGATPLKNPLNPSVSYSARVTLLRVGFIPSAPTAATCKRVLTTSKGLVSNPEVNPAHTPAPAWTAATNP
eukprot:CAMPEP_0198199832 /NCGR_PEP_ID=MMETSP1445-20131203/2976_1 /TAXON_ID=36898 /ORGANISM="Pyramimonas sp., Strain CCMP2087" /LENGTH=80 /DNA_ID=CAMNT_0043869733 /DNA_START=471 /DNA_END=710 /DNA_ORIENTATION=+